MGLLTNIERVSNFAGEKPQRNGRKRSLTNENSAVTSVSRTHVYCNFVQSVAP